MVGCRLWIVLFLVLWRDCIVLADNWSNNPGHSGIALSGAPSITGFQLYFVLYYSSPTTYVPYHTIPKPIQYHTIPYRTISKAIQNDTIPLPTAYCSQYKPMQDQRSRIVDVSILGFVFQQCFIRESIIQTQALAAKSIKSEILTGSLML